MPQPPSPVVLLSGFGMMLVAVAAVLLWQRGKESLWRIVGIGALAWVVAVVLKIAWAVPTNKLVESALQHVLPKSVADPLFWLYIGLLTGLFECGITQLFVVKTRLKQSDWDQAVAFGISFGAMEAFVLGAVTFIGLLAVIIFFEIIPTETRNEIAQVWGSTWARIPLPILERLITLPIHALSCVLIVYGVLVRQWRWFWLSFGYKSSVDAFAAWAVLSFGVTDSLPRQVQFEAMVTIFALLGLIGLWMMRTRFKGLQGEGSEAHGNKNSQGGLPRPRRG